eukprot:1192344-Prorocentrum_minimum.AAC.7
MQRAPRTVVRGEDAHPLHIPAVRVSICSPHKGDRRVAATIPAAGTTHKRAEGRGHMIPIPTHKRAEGRGHMIPIPTHKRAEGRGHMIPIPTQKRAEGRGHVIPIKAEPIQEGMCTRSGKPT